MSWKLSTLAIGLLSFLASSVMSGGQEQHPGPQNGSPVVASGDASPPAAAKQTDSELIEKQKTCPVSDQPLGSMGEPVKVVVKGRTVFLCCAGCKPKLVADPDKYLKALDEKKSQLPGAARAAEEMKGSHHPLHLQHITTQAEAEALKPGDSISMVCSMCKNVVVMPVTTGKEHVKLMTIGQKHTCADCGGIVTVVGSGKGEEKNEDVKHVCSKCGDDAMFVCASKPGSGASKHHEEDKK
ncbi:MAG: hypothetical protein ACYC6N_26730 [Pirellulaceae bacterium]